MASWENHEAKTRGRFREVNERIAELGANFQVDGRSPFVCECGNLMCMQAIELTNSEYEAIRAHGRRYAIALDHENPSLEVVVHQNARFAVAETFVGEASRVPEDTNPRVPFDERVSPQLEHSAGRS